MTPAPPRLQQVDALRGFALLGILTVNIWAFADPYYATGTANPSYTSALDQALRGIVALLFETKFYLLFSFLFGYSVTLQMDAAERAGTAFMPRMLRRHGGLLVLGLLHGLLLYNGDILALYALLGLMLLACRRMAPRTACRTGIALLAASGTLWLALGLAAPMADAGMAPPGDEPLARLAAYQGSAAATLEYHMANLADVAAALALLQGGGALAMFFIGFAAGRTRLLEQPRRLDAAGRRLLVFGLPVGLAGAFAYACTVIQPAGVASQILGYGISLLTAPLLTGTCVAALLWLFKTGPGRRVEQALAPMGKMALSHYLGQSLLLNLLFTGYGLGWSNRLPPAAVLACVPLAYGLQMALGRWWLRRHAYGPAEWVLRAVTTASVPRWRSRTGGVSACRPGIR